MKAGIIAILQRIIGEAGDCDCDDHAIRFSRAEVIEARRALAVEVSILNIDEQK